ncbi:MAG: hypothetical protein CML05_20520 [Pseudozobellia sp.]|nr:hypothetical protein [Pseudozobellia sp.]|tara:strand:+ start:59247 stop:60965 length:1719 start_codon:yes stop_codon:yes gene_type:complete
MYKRYFFSLCCVLFLIGCSEADEDMPVIEKGNLEVQVWVDNKPSENANVTTSPSTLSLVTDSEGSVLFENISVGEYEVKVVLPEAPDDYFTRMVNVLNDETIFVKLELEAIPVIYPQEIDLSLVLVNLYEKIGDGYSFDGFSTFWGDIGTDIAYVNKQTNGELTTLDKYLLSSGDPIVNRVFSEYYAIIRNINMGLDCLNDPECLGAQEIDEVEFEAKFKFLRALTYFNLVKIYGNPVLVTTLNTNLETPSEYVQGGEEVYQQIIEDLVFAEQYLPHFESVYESSREAATALLGKVYMQMAGFPLLQTEKYTKALEQFKKLLNLLSLEESYSNVFNSTLASQSLENLFAVKFSSGFYGEAWGPLGFATGDWLLLSRSFIIASGAGNTFTDPVAFPISVPDQRFYHNIASFTVAGAQIEDAVNPEDWRPLKFKSKLDITESDIINYSILIRYADILLLLAEAENNVNGPTALAYEAFNSVRRRAYQNENYDLPSGLSQQEFFNAIVEERKLELCFEGLRKDDLVRWQLLEDKLLEFNESHPEDLKDFQSHEYIWPIPQNEMDRNSLLQQNPGY